VGGVGPAQTFWEEKVGRGGLGVVCWGEERLGVAATPGPWGPKKLVGRRGKRERWKDRTRKKRLKGG